MTESTTVAQLDVSTSADTVSKPTGADTPADALGENPSMSTSDGDSNQSGDNVCPECGREFKNQHGMRIHYSSQHDGSLYTTKECEWCGDEFRKRPGAKRVFCSYECRGERRSAEGLPARSRRTTLTCEGCGEEFDVPRSDAEAGKKYCSMECRDKDSKIQTRECEWCGGEYRGYERRRFCSQDCYGQWMANEMPIEQHARYKGEDKLTSPPDYGPGWDEEKREAVRERDGRRCVVCDMSESEHLEKCGRKLNVHHIIPARQSDDPEEHNALRNLISLCAGCHRKWEGIPLRPDVAD